MKEKATKKVIVYFNELMIIVSKFKLINVGWEINLDKNLKTLKGTRKSKLKIVVEGVQ